MNESAPRAQDAGSNAPVDAGSGEDASACVATVEQCDMQDDDCDGRVDESLVRPCGPPARGQCRSGVETCVEGRWSECAGAVEPSTEVCDAERNDENCDGVANEGCACSAGEVNPCPASEGICQPGSQRCVDGRWGRCEGAGPTTVEVCDRAERDEDCDGMVNEGCECTEGQTDRCESDRPGVCTAGIQMCAGGRWGECVGTRAPGDEVCDAERLDEDCDGAANEDCCEHGATQSCMTDRPGMCREGRQRCEMGRWGECASEIEPAPERCDGLDNDCSGAPDDGALCPEGQRCTGGRCVECTRATERTDCANTDPCSPNRCGEGGRCEPEPLPDGSACELESNPTGVCVDGACIAAAEEEGEERERP